MKDHLRLQIKNSEKYTLIMGSGTGTRDYEKLYNKPSLNGIELVGNMLLSNLFPDGILINCGDSTGYPEPVISPGVPSAEGGGF